MHLNMQQIAQHVDHDMALTTFHFFAAVDAAIFAVVLGFDALRVDDAVAGTGRSAVFFRRCRFKSSNAFSHTPFLFHRLKWS